mmetsp:Transcript_40374/g.65415  ORF Transcript_40374/g.65415 Transcript_40374/m.65415 type:complete len:204 (-) Transcript_40374:11366-11977(-)
MKTSMAWFPQNATHTCVWHVVQLVLSTSNNKQMSENISVIRPQTHRSFALTSGGLGNCIGTSMRNGYSDLSYTGGSGNLLGMAVKNDNRCAAVGGQHLNILKGRCTSLPERRSLRGGRRDGLYHCLLGRPSSSISGESAFLDGIAVLDFRRGVVALKELRVLVGLRIRLKRVHLLNINSNAPIGRLAKPFNHLAHGYFQSRLG